MDANRNVNINPTTALDNSEWVTAALVPGASAAEAMSTTAARDTIDARTAWFARECERNGVRIEACVRSAERVGDREMAAFFRRAQREACELTCGATR
jgi:hypothetical protein